jgi:hypothetical protein
MRKNTFKTDWLASRPVFYNKKTLKISHNINDVIDFNNIEIHPEGFNNYLDFGYSVFGQTPIKNIKFLRHSSEIFVKNKEIKIIEHPDPIKKWFREKREYSDENDIMNLIKYKIQDYEKNTNGPIIIPTSGGFDSRLLNYFIKEKTRIRAFTYGVSKKQNKSFESIHAKKLCEALGIQWKRIELGDFHKYFNDWDNLFGVSTHAHGMYHIEFYKKILRNKNLEGANFMSGIFGDVWAGSVEFKNIQDHMGVISLGYTHGVNANVNKSNLKCTYELRKKFYKEESLDDYRCQIINTIRLKIILISYLLSLPEYYGFKSWTPFLDIDIALGMLNLPPKRRKNRQWQIDFFKKNKIYFENLKIKKTYQNYLDYSAIKKYPPPPLDKSLLQNYVNKKYIDSINRNIKSEKINKIQEFFSNRYVKGGFSRIGIKEPVLKSYFSYVTLKPIENILKKKKI